MLSPKVQDLVERCRRTQQATATYAPLLAEHRRSQASSKAAGAFQASALQLGVEVEEAADAAAEADRSHSRAVEAHQGWAKRRDEVASRLYREVSGFRKDWRGFLATGAVKQSLPFSGKTPRKPSTLIAWTHTLLKFWGDGEGFFTHDFYKTGLVARVLRARELLDELETAYDGAGKANLMRAAARDDRRQAIEKCELLLKENGTIVERFLCHAGRRDLAVKIRGKHPRGRPRKSDPPRSRPKAKADAVVAEPDAEAKSDVEAAPMGRVLSWFEHVARKAGRLFRPEVAEHPDLRRAA